MQMTTRLRLAAAFVSGVLPLAVIADAGAKGPTSARVCGVSRCVTVRDLSLVARAIALNSEPYVFVKAPRPAPFYTVNFGGLPAGYDLAYVWPPSRTRLRIDDWGSPYWLTIPRPVEAALAHMARGLRPYPASHRWGAQRRSP